MVSMISSPPRILAFVLALAASVAAVAAFAAPASASRCGTLVQKDWSDNSRIDGTYPLHCYQDAVNTLPQDIFDYSNAAEVIRRAFLDAGGRNLQMAKRPEKQRRTTEIVPTSVANASSPSSFPIPLLVLGGVALALLAAGSYGYVSRRRRADE
jgi:hypothetical protein